MKMEYGCVKPQDLFFGQVAIVYDQISITERVICDIILHSIYSIYIHRMQPKKLYIPCNT